MKRTIACILLVLASHSGAEEPQTTVNDEAAKTSGVRSENVGERPLPQGAKLLPVPGEVSAISEELKRIRRLEVEQARQNISNDLPEALDEDQRKRLAIAILRSGASVYLKRGFGGEPVMMLRYSRASFRYSFRDWSEAIELLRRFRDPDHTPDDRDVYDLREATRALEVLGLRYDENLRLVDERRGETVLRGNAPSMQIHAAPQTPTELRSQVDDLNEQRSAISSTNESLRNDTFRPLDPATAEGGGVEEALQSFDRSLRESASAIEELKRGYIIAESQAAEFAVQVRGGLDPERADLGVGKEQREKLESLVAKAFELRLSLQRKQLADAEERLTATRKRLDRREDSAKSIIERRVDALLFRIDESLLRLSNTSPSQVRLPAITSQDTIALQADKHPELQRFKRYFGLELSRDADGRIVFYRRNKIEGDEEPVNELRHLVQLEFFLINLKNPGERPVRQTRQINDVEDLTKFLREDSPRLVTKLVVHSNPANQESESNGRPFFELIPGPETSLDPEMREKLSQTQAVLAKHLGQTRERMGQIEKSKFDERQNQALRDTLPTEIVKLEVELGKSEIQWRHLQELQRSEPSQRLAEVLEKLESPSIKQAESAVLDRERVQLQGKLSAQIRAIISSDVSLSDAKVGTATAGALKKVEVLSTRIDMLESQLTSADLKYQQAKDARSEASRLRAEISRIEEFSEFVATRLSSAGNDASTIDDASCRVGISCDRAMNIHYIDRPVTPVKRSDDGKERRLDAKIVGFAAPMSGPFNLRLSIADGNNEKALAPLLNVNVAIDFFETETLRREGVEFHISDQDLDFLEAYERITIALVQNPAGSTESRRIREQLDSPSSVLAYSDDPTKTLLAVVSIRNMNEDLRFLKLAGTWTPVADSIPHIAQDLLTSSDGADIHFSVDKLLWTSLPVEASANDIVKFYSEQYADSELTPVVTGTVRPRRDENATSEVHKEFFVVFRKSGGDTVLVIGVVPGSRPTIKLAGDGTLMQLTWNGSDGLPSPLPHDGESSVPILYRPIETEF